MKINLTESQLTQIVKESIETVLNEARGLNSMKLYNVIKQHGGIGSSDYHGRFLQQIKDEDVIGVLSGDEYYKIVNKGRLATWAKNQGFNVDEKQIGWIYLKDGAMISYVLPENHSNMWYDEKHEKNRNEYMHPDGAKEYQWQNNGNKPSAWSPKGYTEDRKERFQTLQALQRRNKK
jgi:hypothetical protein